MIYLFVVLSVLWVLLYSFVGLSVLSVLLYLVVDLPCAMCFTVHSFGFICGIGFTVPLQLPLIVLMFTSVDVY